MLCRLLALLGAFPAGALRRASKVRRSVETQSTQPSLLQPLPILVWDEDPSNAERLTGTLTVPLDPQSPQSEDEGMPKLKLRLLMRPAPTQPAPLGTVLVHCGGPSSDKSCMQYIAPLPGSPWGTINRDVADKYNIFAIDQRGIGESEPRLACPSNTATLPPVGSIPKLSDFSPECPCSAIPDSQFNFKRDEDTHLLEYFTELEASLDLCYASPHLRVGGANGTDFNVVDYIGTSYLAHDLNIFRKAIGAEKLSIFGISYGTWVGSVYASIYPQFSDKIVIIGNLPPAPNAHDFSRDYAMNHQMIVAEFVDRCRKFRGSRGQPCMVHEPRAAFKNLTNQLAEGLWSTDTDFGTVSLTPNFITGAIHGALNDLTHRALDGSTLDSLATYLQYGQMLDQLMGIPSPVRRQVVEDVLNTNCHMVMPISQIDRCVDKDGHNLALKIEDSTFQCPTWKQYGVCVSAQMQQTWAQAQNLMFIGVMSGDVPSHLMPDAMVDLVERLSSQFGVIGRNAGFVMDSVALWPGKATYPGIGSEAKPLIMATLEDSATGFKWTQEMKMAFPFGHLMTFQGFFHGFPSVFLLRTEHHVGAKGEWDCFVEMQNYMLTGILPPNGFVCHVERYGVDPGNPAAVSFVERFSFLANKGEGRQYPMQM